MIDTFLTILYPHIALPAVTVHTRTCSVLDAKQGKEHMRTHTCEHNRTISISFKIKKYDQTGPASVKHCKVPTYSHIKYN